MTTYKKSIKRFILSLSLLLAAVFLIGTNINKVHAQSGANLEYEDQFSGTFETVPGGALDIWYESGSDFWVSDGNNGGSITFRTSYITLKGINLEYESSFSGQMVSVNSATIEIYYEASYGNDFQVDVNGASIRTGYITIKGLGQTRPGISGNEHFASNVDTPANVQSFINELTAYDDIDGDISSNIYIVEDNYTSNKTTLGKHQVTVAVEDSSANYSEFIFFVHVSDITDPIVSADFSDKTIGYDKTYDISAFVNTLVLSDNYYSNAELTTTITRDDYTANKTKLGTYRVEVTVEDPSENKTKVGFNIVVKDTVKPVFNGIREITKSYKNVMSIQDIIKDIKVTDAIDGDLSKQIVVESDSYTGNANRPSKTPYQIVLSVTDAAGNKATHTIEATVIDDHGANWYITNGVTLNLPKDTPMTRIQIIDLLTRANQVNMSASSVITYSADTYTENAGKPGIYTLAFNVKEPNGNSNDYTYAVNVMGASEDDTDIVPDKVSFVDNVKNWLNDNKNILIVSGAVLGLFGLAIVFRKKR